MMITSSGGVIREDYIPKPYELQQTQLKLRIKEVNIATGQDYRSKRARAQHRQFFIYLFVLWGFSCVR